MHTRTARRLAVPALAALLVVAGCSDDDGGDDAASPTTEEVGESTTTTTAAAADEGSTTTEPGDDGPTTTTTTTEGDGTSDSTAPAPADEGQEGAGAPDEEAPDVGWGLDASPYRGEDGKRIAYLCPPDGELDSVWGTGTYTDDSSVCSAAVHAGIVNPVEGGRVVIEIAPGEESYEGSEANGVTSQDYDSWDGSFTFPGG